MSDQVRVAVYDGVMEITFARPEKKNALTNAMYKIWADALIAAESDPDVRVVLHTGEGDAFSAGNDLMDFAAVNTGATTEERHVGRVLRALAMAKKPLIAAVNGLAVGVGTTMILHCDLAFVAEDAKLTTPFVNLALVPEAASSILLPAHVGAKKAFAMFALGEAITGKEAEAFGLVNKALARDQVLPAARAAAAALAAKPPRAVEITKALMRDSALLLNRIEAEGAHFEAQLKTAEAREAFMAFMEKRAPNFSARG